MPSKSIYDAAGDSLDEAMFGAHKQFQQDGGNTGTIYFDLDNLNWDMYVEAFRVFEAGWYKPQSLKTADDHKKHSEAMLYVDKWELDLDENGELKNERLEDSKRLHLGKFYKGDHTKVDADIQNIIDGTTKEAPSGNDDIFREIGLIFDE